MDYSLKNKELAELDFNEFCQFLAKNGNAKKAEFDKKIIKTNMTVYGYSSDDINALFKYFNSHESNILSFPSDDNYETTILQGLLIAKGKQPLFDRLNHLKKWMVCIDNWAHCDTIVSKFKYKITEQNEVFWYAEELMKSEKEFVARCGIIFLFKFLDDDNIDRVFSALEKIDFGRYYVDMAVAWLLATALINHKNATLNFLNNSKKVTDFVYLKTLQKARESFRISPSDKEEYKVLIQKRRQNN